MGKRMSITVFFMVLFFGGLVGYHYVSNYYMNQYFAHFTPPPVSVSATRVKTQDWTEELSAVGTLQAEHTVALSTEAAGKIKAITFKSGQIVKAGDILLRLDDEIAQAELQNAEADLNLAKLDNKRQAILAKTQSTPKSMVDAATTQLRRAQAAKARAMAIISQKTITAPFTGRIGIRQVDLGEIIAPGQTIARLESFNPMLVSFSLPEQDLPQLHIGQAVSLTLDAFPNTTFKAKVSAIDASVDKGTHSILVQASLPNPKHTLYPGLFANVKVAMKTRRHLAIPQTAIDYSLYGNIVYVLEQQGNGKQAKWFAKQRFVKLGPTKGDLVAVISGLKAGERIVSAGQLKLHENAQVSLSTAA